MYKKLSILSLFLFMSLSIFAQQETYVLSGEITDSGDGTLIPGSQITIISELDSIKTDSSNISYVSPDGRFSFELKKGLYYLVVTADGYAGYRDYIDLADNFNIRVELIKDIVYQNSISGKILNESSEPVPYANLYFYDENAQNSAWASSDESGNFQLRNIIPGDYYLDVLSEDYKIFHSDILTIQENTNLEGYQITLESLAVYNNFELTIYYEEGGISYPVENCEVYLWRDYKHSWQDSRSARLMNKDLFGYTDSQGKISFTEINEGYYFASAWKEGFEYSDFTNPNFEVSGNDQKYSMQLKMLPPRITGTVKGKVLIESSGKPVQAYVEFFRKGDMKDSLYTNDDYPYPYSYYSVFTGEDGVFETKIDTGTYIAKATYYNYDVIGDPSYDVFFPSYVFEFYNNVDSFLDADDIFIGENSIVENIDFSLNYIEPDYRVITITGNVKDEAGHVLDYANVDVLVNSGFYICGTKSNNAQTELDGSYKIDIKAYSLNPFELRISAYKEGYTNTYYNNKPAWYMADPIIVSSSANDTLITDINFQIKKLDTESKYRISGSVTDSSNTGISNIYVEAVGLDNYFYSFGISDSLGNYSISDLIEGKYVISFYGEGYQYEYYNNSSIWEEATIVEVNNNLNGIDAQLANGLDYKYLLDSRNNCVLSGEIKDENGNAIQGASVNLLNSDGEIEQSTVTDNRGAYTFSNLTNAYYVISVSKVLYESVNQSITINVLNSNSNFNIVLDRKITNINEEETLPISYELANNYPNPFNPTTIINFSIPERSVVSLKVFNILGQEISTLLNEQLNPGRHEVTFDASGLTSGVYFYKLEAKSFVQVKKMLLMK